MAVEPRKELDAIEVLLQDHRELESLFSEFESLRKNDEEKAGELVTAVCAELAICARLEIEIFYPAVHEAAEEKETEALLDDGADRHEAIRELIEKLGKTASHGRRDAQFSVLSAHAKRHVEEEETKLFPRVRKMKKLDLVAVAAEMKERKSELMVKMGLAEEETI